MKTCTKCQSPKELDYFYTHRSGSQGRMSVCKECVCAAQASRATPCIDCGVLCVVGALRCRKCSGLQTSLRQKGKNNSAYKEGKTTNSEGYVVLSGQHEHPNSFSNGGLLEHVSVMSQHKGRGLLKGEMVHHKNGIKDDNRIENLELCWKQPPGQRVEDLIAYLESTGYKVIREQM